MVPGSKGEIPTLWRTRPGLIEDEVPMQPICSERPAWRPKRCPFRRWAEILVDWHDVASDEQRNDENQRKHEQTLAHDPQVKMASMPGHNVLAINGRAGAQPAPEQRVTTPPARSV